MPKRRQTIKQIKNKEKELKKVTESKRENAKKKK